MSAALETEQSSLVEETNLEPEHESSNSASDFEQCYTRMRSGTWPASQLTTVIGDSETTAGFPRGDQESLSPSAEPDSTEGGGQTSSVAVASRVRSGTPRKTWTRKNAWGNLSYAELIGRAISSNPDGRLTLAQIYDWIVQNVEYFSNKSDSTSSAGWKNSIRHNLSLHERFVRVVNDGAGKSSWWIINPDARPYRSTRRRAATMDSTKNREMTDRRRSASKLYNNASSDTSKLYNVSDTSKLFDRKNGIGMIDSTTAAAQFHSPLSAGVNSNRKFLRGYDGRVTNRCNSLSPRINWDAECGLRSTPTDPRTLNRVHGRRLFDDSCHPSLDKDCQMNAKQLYGYGRNCSNPQNPDYGRLAETGGSMSELNGCNPEGHRHCYYSGNACLSTDKSAAAYRGLCTSGIAAYGKEPETRAWNNVSGTTAEGCFGWPVPRSDLRDFDSFEGDATTIASTVQSLAVGSDPHSDMVNRYFLGDAGVPNNGCYGSIGSHDVDKLSSDARAFNNCQNGNGVDRDYDLSNVYQVKNQADNKATTMDISINPKQNSVRLPYNSPLSQYKMESTLSVLNKDFTIRSNANVNGWDEWNDLDLCMLSAPQATRKSSDSPTKMEVNLPVVTAGELFQICSPISACDISNNFGSLSHDLLQMGDRSRGLHVESTGNCSAPLDSSYLTSNFLQL